MIAPQLTGKGLFVFSDPGGTKPILSFIKLNTQLKEYLVISDRVYTFFSDFGITVTAYAENSEESVLATFKPDFVFTGTSYTSQVENKFIREAKRQHITTYAFIDHYTSFVERFQLNDAIVYPDHICVLDDNARMIAEEKRMDADIIVTGNYYHVFLENWKPSISKNDFLKTLGLELDGRKLCVYGPDPLSNREKRKEIDFDEIEATAVLSKVAHQLNHRIRFVLNPHPNQKIERLLPVTGTDIFVVQQPVHVNTLLYYADVVVGFYSNFLIEATILKKPVIRFFLNTEMDDPLASMNIGTIAYPDTILSELESI